MRTLDTRLDRIAAYAAQHRDDYAAFGHYVNIMWEREGNSSAELDALVDDLAAAVIPHIDCTACANCCRSLTVGLIPDDVTPLAHALASTPEAVSARYVDRAAGARHQEWGVFRHSPCALLKDNRCTVYPYRPASCRTYPALTPDFRWLIDDILAGVGHCPIIFNVITRLQTKLGW